MPLCVYDRCFQPFPTESAGRAEGVLRELLQPAARGAGPTAQDQPHRPPRQRQRHRDSLHGREARAPEGNLHLPEVRPGEERRRGVLNRGKTHKLQALGCSRVLW